ncbi:hypothetical protein LCGC14_2386710 [marine sediment metagenome]|uniref:Uncharacterized protein n=1 Tax=marine sediment metagenome TaxID=412755 RepID=A0A0F9EU12_9ZZZZ
MTELEYLFQAVRRNILLARTDDIKARISTKPIKTSTN